MFADDGGWGEDDFFVGGNFDTDALEKKEEETTLSRLLDLEEKLRWADNTTGYSQNVGVGEGVGLDGVGSAEMAAEVRDAQEFRRIDVGYHAHTDGVDDEELSLWHRTFPYFGVSGMNVDGKTTKEKGIEDMSVSISLYSPLCNALTDGDGTRIDNAQEKEKKTDDGMKMQMYENDNEPFNLSIMGKAIIPSVSSSPSVGMEFSEGSGSRDERKDEVDDIVHGILEEWIEVHCLDDMENRTKTDNNSKNGKNKDTSKTIDPNGNNDALGLADEPLTCRRKEIAALLFDTVWASVIDRMAPAFEELKN